MTEKAERLRVLGVPGEQLKELFPLLESGVYMTGHDGSSMASFLVNDLGLEPDYVQDEIQTVFLNSSPVDDFSSARIHEDAVVALSAAMPGLVGAVMRKSGFFSSLRGGISCKADQEGEGSSEPILVKVKAFNMLRGHVAELFFRKGVYLPSGLADEVLRSLPDSFWQSCSQIEIKGQRFDPNRYELMLPKNDNMLLLSMEAPEQDSGGA